MRLVAAFSLVASACLLVACSDAGVTKFNSDPTAQITSHASGDTVREGFSESLRGVVGDPDHGADDLSVSWLVDGAELCEESAPDAEGVVTCALTFAPDGGEVVLEVRDPAGGSGSARVSLDVQPTDAPVAAIDAPVEDGVYYSDQLIPLEGTVSDGEDPASDLMVTWETVELGDLGLDVEVTSEGAVEAFANLDEGEHALRLRVVDTTGKEAVDSVVIDVGPPNSDPTCGITAPEDGAAGAEGEEVRFEAAVDDVDVKPDWLSVSWDSDTDGFLGSATPTSDGEVGLVTSDLTVATHRMVLTVTDEVGATCTDAIYYTVGTPPELELSSPTTGDTVNEGEAVAFAATVSDDQDLATELALSWSSDLDGEFSTQGADSLGSISFSTDELSPGAHALTVRVTDSDGLYSQTALDLTINEVPTAPTVSLAPDPATTEDTLTATASGSTDPDSSGTVTYSYAWTVDGASSSVSTSATFPSSDTVKGSTYRVVVTPSDGTGDGPTGEAEITVDNTAPELSGPTLSASTAAVGDTLTCSASATDVDAADSPTVTYAWSSGDTGTTYTVVDTDDPGDTITCTATADDGDGGTDTASASATVSNTDPVVDSIEVSPSTAKVGDTLTCAASASDEDGDSPTVTYAWSSGDTGTTYTVVDSDDPGDTITCTATADDDDGGTASDTASATVENTDPELGTVSISPSSATNDDTLTCTASATDEDGGSPSVSYTWSGSAAGSLGTGSNLDLSVTSAASAETVTCTATASDTDGGSDSDSAELTLDNRDPDVTVSLSPTSPSASDTLTCTATTSDDDDDAVSLDFSWTVGGSSTSASSSGSSSSTLAGAFSATDSVTCTATADDGKGGSTQDSASVTITNTTPTVSSVSISPTTAYTDDTLTASAVTSDADGDSLSLSYDWYVEGALVQSGSDDTLEGVDWFDKDDEVYVEVEADDGNDTATGTSSTLTISNTPPTAPDLVLEETCAAVELDGVDDAIDVADYAGLTMGSAFTLEAWVFWDGSDSNRYQTLFAQNSGNASGTHEWHFAVASSSSTACGGSYTEGALLMDMWNSGACSHSTTTLTAGTWQHVAAVYSGGQVSLFIDGTESTTVPRSASRTQAGSEPLSIGWGSDNSEDWTFSGAIDSARISTKALYSGSFTPDVLTADSDTLSLWRLDEGSGTDVADDVGGYDGSIDGASWVEACANEGELLCVVETESSDADGDSVTYTFAWTDDDGADYTDATDTYETGDTVPGEDFGGAEDWTCTVTPDDGDDDGDDGTATITTQTGCDADQDGYDDEGGYCGGTDCDDDDDTVHPFAGDTHGDGVDSDCDDLDCEADDSGGVYFAVCDEGGIDWSDAEGTCEDAGYELATIEDATEDADVLSLMTVVRASTSLDAWIGFTDIASEGTWVWVDGSSSSYTNWLSVAPDNYDNNQHCARMMSTGLWDDVDCSQNKDFVCQYR